MINAIINGLLGMITKLLDVLLLPINALFTNLFPDMTTAINNFNNFVVTYLGNNLSWFFSIFPPIFRNLLFLWFTFVVAYYGIYFSYEASIKIFGVIQKLKFW